MTGLTPKQQRFVEEYAIDGNGKQAAIRAGYSEATAESQASRLLRNVKVAAAVAKSQDAVLEKVEITQEWVLIRLAEIARRCMQEKAVTDAEGNPTGVYKFEPGPATKALELLGKHTGLWPAEAGKGPAPIPIPEPANDATNPALTGVVLAFKKRAGAAK